MHYSSDATILLSFLPSAEQIGKFADRKCQLQKDGGAKTACRYVGKPREKSPPRRMRSNNPRKGGYATRRPPQSTGYQAPRMPFAVAGLAATFLAAGFLATTFLAAGFLATTFFAAGFLAATFLAAGFLAAAAGFFATVFLAAGFLAAGFFAAGFLVVVAIFIPCKNYLTQTKHCIACNHCTPKHSTPPAIFFNYAFGVRILCAIKILVQQIFAFYSKKVLSPENS